VELRKVRAAAVAGHDAPVAAVVGLPHRGVHADFRGHSAHDEGLDVTVLEDPVQIRGVERALARLVHHRLARLRVERGHDVVADLAADQDAAHRPGIADAPARGAPLHLGAGSVGQVRPVALAGVDHQHARGARPVEQRLAGRDGHAQQADVVAERLPEAARLQEVALHVDHHQRGPGGVHRDRLGQGVDGDHAPPGGKKQTTAGRRTAPDGLPWNQGLGGAALATRAGPVPERLRKDWAVARERVRRERRRTGRYRPGPRRP
jgi:hypothetical protein